MPAGTASPTSASIRSTAALGQRRPVRLARALRAGPGAPPARPAAVRPARPRRSKTPTTRTSGRSSSCTRTRVFVVLRTAHLVRSPRHLEFGETHIFLGRNYVVTVRHGSLRSHIGVRQRCESTPHLLAQGSGLRPLRADGLRRRSVPADRASRSRRRCEELEERSSAIRSSGDATARIYQLKRDLLALRRPCHRSSRSATG